MVARDCCPLHVLATVIFLVVVMCPFLVYQEVKKSGGKSMCVGGHLNSTSHNSTSHNSTSDDLNLTVWTETVYVGLWYQCTISPPVCGPLQSMCADIDIDDAKFIIDFTQLARSVLLVTALALVLSCPYYLPKVESLCTFQVYVFIRRASHYFSYCAGFTGPLGWLFCAAVYSFGNSSLCVGFWVLTITVAFLSLESASIWLCMLKQAQVTRDLNRIPAPQRQNVGFHDVVQFPDEEADEGIVQIPNLGPVGVDQVAKGRT